MHADFTAEPTSQDVVLTPPPASLRAPVSLSPVARAEVQRVLDSAARRILAERLALEPTNSDAPVHKTEATPNPGRQPRHAEV